MGSITLRKKRDRWYARFYDPSKTPPRKSVALYTTRKRIAQRKRRDLEDAWTRGDYDPWLGGWLIERKTLEEAADAFLEAKRREGKSDNTVEAYRYALEGLKHHAPAEKDLRAVRSGHAKAYIYAPKQVGDDEEPTSNATKRHRWRHLRAFFNWAMGRGLVEQNPVEDVAKPRREERKTAFLSPEDVETILRAVDAHRKLREAEPGPTADDRWLKQLIRVAVGTGLRRGELLNLRWGDVDVDGRQLLVRHREGFTTKNHRERVVPLAGDALEMLRSMKDERRPLDDKPVFVDGEGDPPKPSRVTKRFKFYVRKAKLDDREDLCLHSTRHTTASWLSMQGVPLRTIAEILGHSSTQVTERYSHLQPEVMRRAMDETFEER